MNAASSALPCFHGRCSLAPRRPELDLGAEAAGDHADEAAVHRPAHDVAEDRARAADQRAGDDHRGVVQREAHRRRRPARVGVEHRDHDRHVRPADRDDQQEADREGERDEDPEHRALARPGVGDSGEQSGQHAGGPRCRPCRRRSRGHPCWTPWAAPSSRASPRLRAWRPACRPGRAHARRWRRRTQDGDAGQQDAGPDGGETEHRCVAQSPTAPPMSVNISNVPVIQAAAGSSVRPAPRRPDATPRFGNA